MTARARLPLLGAITCLLLSCTVNVQTHATVTPKSTPHATPSTAPLPQATPSTAGVVIEQPGSEVPLLPAGSRPTPQPTNLPNWPAGAPLLVVTYSGGLCPTGLCSNQTYIQPDGSITDKSGKPTAAFKVPRADIDALVAAIKQTDFTAFEASDDKGPCGSMADGSDETLLVSTSKGAQDVGCIAVGSSKLPFIVAANTVVKDSYGLPSPSPSPTASPSPTVSPSPTASPSPLQR
jgi:hypothetical protein